MNQGMILIAYVIFMAVVLAIFTWNYWKSTSRSREERLHDKTEYYKEIIVLMYRQLNFSKDHYYSNSHEMYTDPEEIISELKEDGIECCYISRKQF